jgi:hypothetical protein
MAHYVLIHGANSSGNSFNYILSQLELNKKDYTKIQYKSSDGFFFNLEQMAHKVKDKENIIVVGHSLGGLYALHLTKLVNVVSGISISTPFNGSSLADWAKFMMPNYQLWHDIGTNSHPVIMGKEITIDIPWTQIVSTKGRVPWIVPDNDGVVTIRSQKSRNDMKFIELPYNHYEIMCVPQTLEVIKTHRNMV